MLRLEIPSCRRSSGPLNTLAKAHYWASSAVRSEEHTSELQSLRHLVCRLLLEKKKKRNTTRTDERKNKVSVCKYSGTNRRSYIHSSNRKKVRMIPMRCSSTTRTAWVIT